MNICNLYFDQVPSLHLTEKEFLACLKFEMTFEMTGGNLISLTGLVLDTSDCFRKNIRKGVA